MKKLMMLVAMIGFTGLSAQDFDNDDTQDNALEIVGAGNAEQETDDVANIDGEFNEELCDSSEAEVNSDE